MATFFYCFETMPTDLPEAYVVVPPKQIGEQEVQTEVTDEETGETTLVTVLDEEGNPVMEPVYEPTIHINTMQPVDAWEAMRCQPETPRMIYG